MAQQALHYEDVALGDPVPALERTPAAEAVARFVNVAQRRQIRLFTDDQAAREAGFPASIVPGDMVLAYIAQALRSWAPQAVVTKLDVIFRYPMLHHRTLSVSGVVTDLRDDSRQVQCDVYVSNAEGDWHIVGVALLTFPSGSDESR